MTIIATMTMIMYTNVPKTIYKSRVKIGYIYLKTVLGNIILIRDIYYLILLIYVYKGSSPNGLFSIFQITLISGLEYKIKLTFSSPLILFSLL
jgi:hypothetical protein